MIQIITRAVSACFKRVMQVYGSSKFALFPDHIAALRDGRLIAPVHVRIKPINKCNHACWYCAYRADNLALGEDMNEADRISEPKMREREERSF